MSAKKASSTAKRGARNTAPKQEAPKAQAKEPVAAVTEQAAITEKELTPPAKAEAISPAIKEAKVPVIKEEAKAPAIKQEAAAPMVQQDKTLVVAPKAKQAFTPIDLGPNPYLPHVATVLEVIEETHNIKTFRVAFDDAEAMKNFTFKAGQVGQLSLFGSGEATFVINSPPSQKNHLQFSVMRTGEVTEALHKLSAGDKVGVRGPLGNAFPCEDWKGKNVFFVGGGIGMAPIRTIMLHVLENKQDYKKISLLYGARSPKDMAFSYEVKDWQMRPDLDCTLTIDAPCEGWECEVGLIPHILQNLSPNPADTVVVLCGPPIMIKFTVEALEKMNFPPEQIITTLEKRMKCGIGICGRCNIGSKYVCVDGPVFSWAELKELPPEL